MPIKRRGNVRFISKGKGRNRKVIPIRQKPYGEPRSRAARQTEELRKKGKRARLIETNRRLKLYAPYESILKGGKILSVAHSASLPKRDVKVERKAPESPTRSPEIPEKIEIKQVESKQTENQGTSLPEHKTHQVEETDEERKRRMAEEWEKEREEGIKEIQEKIEEEQAWEKFLEDLRNRPKPKEKRTEEEVLRRRQNENYNKIVREIGKIRDKANTGEVFTPLNAKIVLIPHGEQADFYVKNWSMMSIGFVNVRGPRGRREAYYYADVNTDMLKDDKAYLKETAMPGKGGTQMVSVTGSNWQKVVKWIDETVDFRKLEAGK